MQKSWPKLKCPCNNCSLYEYPEAKNNHKVFCNIAILLLSLNLKFEIRIQSLKVDIWKLVQSSQKQYFWKTSGALFKLRYWIVIIFMSKNMECSTSKTERIREPWPLQSNRIPFKYPCRLYKTYIQKVGLL